MSSGAGQWSPADVDLIRQLTLLESVVSGHVTLLPGRAGSFTATCPFHDDPVRSLVVHRSRQQFHCFGCGQGGDVIDFVARIEGVSHPDAVTRLATRIGFTR